MDDHPCPPPTDEVAELLKRDAREQAAERLDTVRQAVAEERKTTVRSLRTLAEDRPEIVGSVCGSLAPFLGDDERSIRLSTAKLFVAVAETVPDAVVPFVPVLAARLADDEEFYYVRARCAEALGYVALEHPDAVGDPEILADFRVGLSFDEPEVKKKLAKALEYVALGDPERLRHQVSSLAEHLDDGNELVRYHLCTALVAIGCAYPDRLAEARESLLVRLEDESPQVRGRAGEALGLLARSQPQGDAPVDPDDLSEMASSAETPFAAERLRFALGATDPTDRPADTPDSIGTVEGLRGTTADAVEAITSPDSDRECPHCGLALPEAVPPMCPRCGAPI